MNLMQGTVHGLLLALNNVTDGDVSRFLLKRPFEQITADWGTSDGVSEVWIPGRGWSRPVSAWGWLVNSSTGAPVAPAAAALEVHGQQALLNSPVWATSVDNMIAFGVDFSQFPSKNMPEPHLLVMHVQPTGEGFMVLLAAFVKYGFVDVDARDQPAGVYHRLRSVGA